MRLKNLLLEAEYTHIGYGKYKEKGKEKDTNAQTFKKDDKGNFTPISSDEPKGGKDVKKDTSKVNIFDKPSKEEPKKQEPSKTDDRWGDRFELGTPAIYTDSNGKEYSGEVVMNPSNQRVQIGGKWTTIGKGTTKGIQVYGSDTFIVPDDWNDAKSFDDATENPSKEEPKSSQPKAQRKGNPEVNKAVRAKADSFGITPEKLGKEEYQKKMAQAAIEALTDSNYHSEARELISKLEGKPELAEKPDYPSMDDPKFNEKMKAIKAKYASKYADDVDDDARKLGTTASQEAGWSGDDAIDGIAYTLRMKGFHKLADTIQSVIKENKSTRLKKLV